MSEAEADRAKRIKAQKEQYEALRTEIAKTPMNGAAVTAVLEKFSAGYFAGEPPAGNVASYKIQIASIVVDGTKATTDAQRSAFQTKIYQYMHDYAADDALKAEIKAANEQVKAPAAPAAAPAPAPKPAPAKTPEQLEMERLQAELKTKEGELEAAKKKADQQETVKKLEHKIAITKAQIDLKNAEIGHTKKPDETTKAALKSAQDKLREVEKAPASAAEAKPAAPKTPEQLEMEKLNDELKRDKATLSGLEKQQNQQEAIKKKKHEIKIVEAKIKLKNAQISTAANPNDKNLADAVKNAETELSALTKEGGGEFSISKWFDDLIGKFKDGNFSWGTAIAALIAGLLGSTIIGGIFGGMFGEGILGTVLKVGVGIATAFMGAKMWSSFTSDASTDAPAAPAPGKAAQPVRAQGQVLELSPNVMSEIGKMLQDTKYRPDLLQILPGTDGKPKLNVIHNVVLNDPKLGGLITPEALRFYTDKGQFNIPMDEILTMSQAQVAERRTRVYGAAPQASPAAPARAAAPAPAAAAAPAASLSTSDKSFLDAIRDKVSGWSSQTQQSDSIPAGEAPGWVPPGAPTVGAAAVRTR